MASVYKSSDRTTYGIRIQMLPENDKGTVSLRQKFFLSTLANMPNAKQSNFEVSNLLTINPGENNNVNDQNFQYQQQTRVWRYVKIFLRFKFFRTSVVQKFSNFLSPKAHQKICTKSFTLRTEEVQKICT